jgi:hypothetical protein
MKHRNRETAVTLILAIGLFGCAQKPAEESTQSKTAKSAPPKPAAVTLTVPTGTELDVRLITGLNSEVNKTGDAFDGTIETPVMVGEKTAIPKGAEVTGRVTSAVPSGRLKQRAELWVKLSSIKLGGKTYEISTTTTGHKEGTKATRDLIFIGGGAGAGAAIGGIAGRGKGAGIGAAVGAAAGTAGAMVTGHRDIKFPPETVLRFRLQQDLQLQH